MAEHALQINWDKQNAFVKTALMAKAVKLTKELQQLQLNHMVSGKLFFKGICLLHTI
jgi:hypothetical protein